jgi:cytochrome c556
MSSCGRFPKAVAIGAYTLFLFLTAHAATAENDTPQSEVLEVMATHIIPASTTLWEFEVPVPPAHWAVLEKAAAQLVAGADLLKKHARGSTGIDWAAEQDWQQYLAEMREAGEAALQAARQQDLDAFENAGYAVYPPCESCHNVYNSGVVGGN